jgi:glycerophosphoryl diester phosphodiesterase
MPGTFWGKTPIAVAHRGGNAAGQGRRNTLAAFNAAHKLGYDYFETDVINTKDGRVIIAHGAMSNLTARLRGTFSVDLLQNLTYKQVKSGLRVKGEQLPLLEDLLLRFPTTKFFIDPKTDEVVEPLAALIAGLKVQDRVCLGSFRYRRVQKLRRLLDGRGHFALIIGRNNWLAYLPRLKTGRLKGLEAVYLHHSFVSRPMLRLVHSKGLKALIWTCNSPLSIKHAVKCGADGVISDRIDLLKEILGPIKRAS